jgi:Putative zinc-finger/HEAT repeats
MNCQQISRLMPDYLEGAVTAAQAREVETHLQNCPTCSDEVAVWKKLAQLPAEQPSPESRARFEAMLHAFPSAPAAPQPAETADGVAVVIPGWRTIARWLRSPIGALAWSAALLLIGLFVGTRINTPVDTARSQELAAMHAELTNMRQLVVLSMLQQQSAGERLQGVSWSSREDQLDPQVQAALLRTLRSDGSVDVRLAALDALSRHASQPQIRKGVVEALQEQQSPLVQVALIDLLSEWHDPDAAQRLRNFQQIPNLNPVVRQRADWAVSKLQ